MQENLCLYIWLKIFGFIETLVWINNHFKKILSINTLKCNDGFVSKVYWFFQDLYISNHDKNLQRIWNLAMLNEKKQGF